MQRNICKYLLEASVAFKPGSTFYFGASGPAPACLLLGNAQQITHPELASVLRGFMRESAVHVYIPCCFSAKRGMLQVVTH